jgi:hypothetical protein
MKLNYDEIIIIYLLSADLIWTKFVLVKWETLYNNPMSIMMIYSFYLIQK